MKTLNIGLIGLGWISIQHMKGYFKLLPKVKVSAICDKNEEVLEQKSKEWDIKRCFTDPTELLGLADIEAVDIMLPHNEHLNMVRAAADAGKHIFLEKSLARDRVEGEKIVNLVEKTGIRLMVGNNLLFHPVIQELHNMITKNAIGKIALVQAHSLGWIFYQTPQNFRLSLEKTGGGALIDTGTHFIYLLRYLLGDITKSKAIAARLLNDKHEYVAEGDDVSILALQFNTNVVGTLTISYSTKIPGWRKHFPEAWEQRIDVYGSEGAIRANLSQNRIHVFQQQKEKKEKWTEVQISEKDPYTYSYCEEIKHFVDCLLVGKPFMETVSPKSSLRDVEIIDKAYADCEFGLLKKNELCDKNKQGKQIQIIT